MKQYGDLTDLPIDIANSIMKIIEKLNKVNEECISIYYGYPIIELDDQETIMKACIISRKAIYAFYDDSVEMKIYERHLTKILLDSPDLSELYFSNTKAILCCLEIKKDFDIEAFISKKDIFTENQYKKINSIIQNIYGLNTKDDRKIHHKSSLGEMIKKRNNEINMLDERQFDMIYKKQINHTRVRGLAGSGKTILLVKKMAYMHYKDRSKTIAYVFYTKSLKQYIENLFKRFYKDFEKYKEPDMDKIKILHSWGGSEMEGFYSLVCTENECVKKAWRDISGYGNERFGIACREVLEKKNNKLKGIFDYIFIDEAQDFSLEFFKLALFSLKKFGNLVYAYDELQSLNEDTNIPNKREIFNEEKCEDINLRDCYRTPKELLVTAHALGLGIYHEKENGEKSIVNMMEDYKIWEAVGYKVVSGQLGYGKKVVLDRDECISYKPEEPLEIFQAESFEEQIKMVSEEILKLITEEDVLPDDILIIDLDSISLLHNFNIFRSIFYSIIGETNINTHLVDKNHALKFTRKNSISYTTIFRAKGNEANIVLILNVEKMGNMATYWRNRLFTALTRAKYKAYICGKKSETLETLINEYRKIKQENYMLNFVYPTKEELSEMKTIAKTEGEKAAKYARISNDLGEDQDLMVQIMKDKFGAGSLEELIDMLQEQKKDEINE